MNVLLLDVGGNFLDFALKCKAAGHAVKWFIAPDKNGERIPVGDGMIEKISDWTKWMRWSDLTVLSDNTRYIQALEPYRKFGYPIFGPNLAAQAMELDRSVGQRIFKEAGIATLPYKTFTSYNDAEAYVRKTMKRFVSKPSGDADKALSYVSKSPKDMIYMLTKWRKAGKLKAPFILQEFCPGVEMAVGGWFGKGGWNAAINENWEHKKLMNDDKGCNTGEMGTVLRYVDKSKLAEKVLFPVSDYLMKVGYTGYLDVAVIIAQDGTPYPMEFTARPGWPHFQITGALHKGDPCEWMADLLDALGWRKTENGMRALMVAVVAMTSSVAMADDVDDAHRLALSGRDSYWNCLAREYQQDSNKGLSGQDCPTTDIDRMASHP